jgi:2-polyprenyl-3-methyl-5-hydroxy-6-metoxy-1,4-benzoquinol methylase
MIKNDETFSNQAFWNQRYVENPELGSGVGSRGNNALYKRAIVKEFLRGFSPTSVLDIGCGDHEVLKDLALPGYIGVDVSPVVIQLNTAKFPDRRFALLDFTHLEEVGGLLSDATLCMEVIIHQHRRSDYDALVQNLLASTRVRGLVSGYLRDPRPNLRSAIIAWHEPITVSLENAGAKDIAVVTTSLESDCLGFVSFAK